MARSPEYSVEILISLREKLLRLLHGSNAPAERSSSNQSSNVDKSRRRFLKQLAAITTTAAIPPLLPTAVKAQSETVTPQVPVTTSEQSIVPEAILGELPTYSSETTILSPTNNLTEAEVHAAEKTSNWTIRELVNNPGFSVEGQNLKFYEISGSVPRVVGNPEAGVDVVTYYAYSCIWTPLSDPNFSWTSNSGVTDRFRPFIPFNPEYVTGEVNGKELRGPKTEVITEFTEVGIRDSKDMPRTFTDYDTKTTRTTVTTGKELRWFAATGVSKGMEKHLPKVYLANGQESITAQEMSPKIYTYNGAPYGYTTEATVQVEPNKILPVLANTLESLQMMLDCVGVDPADEAALGAPLIQIITQGYTDSTNGAYFSGPDATQQPSPENPTVKKRQPALSVNLNSNNMTLFSLSSDEVLAHELFHSLDFRQAWEIIERMKQDAGKFSSIEEAMAVLAMFCFCYVEGSGFLVDIRSSLYLGQYLGESANGFTLPDYFLYVVPLYLINKYGITTDPQYFMHDYLNARDAIEVKNKQSATDYSSTDPAHVIHWMAKEQGYTGKLISLKEANQALLLDILTHTPPEAKFCKVIADKVFTFADQMEYTSDSLLLEEITPLYAGTALPQSWGWRTVGPVNSFKIKAFSAEVARQKKLTPGRTNEFTLTTQATGNEAIKVPPLHIYLPAREGGFTEILTNETQDELDLTEAIQQAQRDAGRADINILILNDTPTDLQITPRSTTTPGEEYSAGILLQFAEEKDTYDAYLPLAAKS